MTAPSSFPPAPPPTRHPMGLFLRTIAAPYAALVARRTLDGVFAADLDRLREALAKGPVVVAGTHVSWWDGQILLILDRMLGVQGRFLVNASSVRELSYLTHLGGIGIERDDPVASLAAIEEAARFLDGPGRLLWIFPQARWRSNAMRPLGLERGVELIARLSGAAVVPVAFVSGWRDLHVPTWALFFGEPITGRKEILPRLEASLVARIDDAERWFDDPARTPLEVVVPSVIVPLEKRFGSRFYLFWATLWRRLTGR